MSDDPDTVQQEVPPPPAKEDPETLALRAQPPRAIRFRRSVVIGLAAGSSLALMATAWIALRPPTFELISGAPEKAPPPRPPADALQSMPATYEDVPKLGPPLPGDLGRPILEHQRTNAIGMEASGIDQGGNPQADASRQAADRVRLIAERKAVLALRHICPKAPRHAWRRRGEFVEIC